jgi:capsular polysaccharide transport system permease protein
MIARFMQTGFGQTAERLASWGRGRLAAAKLPKRRTFAAALLGATLAVLYWGIVASDRYVSEAHVVIHRTSLDSSKDTGSASSMVEQYLLRDYLLSADMLSMLEAKLKLREHYSNWRRDPLSRMWFKNGPFEWFHNHYLSRVSVELDMSAYVLVIKAQGYDPETAHAITAMLVEEGERYMNSLGQRMAGEQVAYLEQQVAKLNERFIQDRSLVMGLQNRKGMVSPQSTAENIAGIIGRLEAQLAELQTRQNAMQEYMMPDSPGIAELNMQIAAVEKQIAREKARLVSPSGQALNKTVEEYQRLQMTAELSTAVYKTALTALEQGRIEATRKLMQVFVLQSPTKPQYPLEPKRIYHIVLDILIISMIAGIWNLLAAIIRDHKD